MKIVNFVMTLHLNNIINQVNQSNHSDDYKNEIIAYATNLTAKNLPIIFDITHLAFLTGISRLSLFHILIDRQSYYKIYKMRKKSGGYRWIMSPVNQLKSIQQWIKTNILEKVSINNSACGFVKGKSIKDNAIKHINQEVVLNIDLYHFFDTITDKRVYGIFRNLGYTEKLSFDLAQLLTVNPPSKYWKELKKENKMNKKHIKTKPNILPQGAPTSPIVTNIISYQIDSIFQNYAEKSNIQYTRYADDLTFSGKINDIISLKSIKDVIRQQGFTINIKKTKFLKQNQRQEVTGITVNSGVFVSKKIIKEIQQELYYCNKYGYKNHLKYKKDKGISIKSSYRDWLLGKISFINSIEPNKAKKMLEIFNMIDWEI